MAETFTQTITVHVTCTVGESGETDFAHYLSEYLTEPSAPFITDYGPDAWGGYDGPKVVRVEVAQNGLVLDTYVAEEPAHDLGSSSPADCRCKHCSTDQSLYFSW